MTNILSFLLLFVFNVSLFLFAFFVLCVGLTTRAFSLHQSANTEFPLLLFYSMHLRVWLSPFFCIRSRVCSAFSSYCVRQKNKKNKNKNRTITTTNDTHRCARPNGHSRAPVPLSATHISQTFFFSSPHF